MRACGLREDKGKWRKYGLVWQRADIEMELKIEEMVLGKNVSSESTVSLIHRKRIQVSLSLQLFC